MGPGINERVREDGTSKLQWQPKGQPMARTTTLLGGRCWMSMTS